MSAEDDEFAMQHGFAAAFREERNEIRLVGGAITVSRVGALVRFASPIVDEQVIVLFDPDADPAEIERVGTAFIRSVADTCDRAILTYAPISKTVH